MFTRNRGLALLFVTLPCLFTGPAWADDAAGGTGEVTETAKETAAKTAKTTQETVDKVAKEVDESETAKEASAGLLQAIYDLAEAMSFSAFHWVAFAVMATGVVSFALQLVLGKLVVLTKGGFSLTAILADALGLVVSLVGLVLTTQAATENSDFTQSPAAVLSAAAVGVIAGFLFYLWGQRQEIEAAKGRGRGT